MEIKEWVMGCEKRILKSPIESRARQTRERELEDNGIVVRPWRRSRDHDFVYIGDVTQRSEDMVDSTKAVMWIRVKREVMMGKVMLPSCIYEAMGLQKRSHLFFHNRVVGGRGPWGIFPICRAIQGHVRVAHENKSS